MMGQDAKLPGYALRAARLLAPSERDGGPAELGQRKQAVEALAVALRVRSRRRARGRWLAVAGAAAVAVAAVAVLAIGRREPAVVAHLDGGQALPEGSVVEATVDRSVGLSLVGGTRMRLTGGGRLAMAELGARQRFILQAGRVWAKVAHLTPGQRFLVSTHDAEVEVRGTAFEVAVVAPRPECDGATTEVRVFEGLVTVRRHGRQWQIAAGERWPGDCRLPAATAVTPPGGVPVVAAPSAPPVRATPAKRRRAAPAAGSTLAEQNDLFAAAMEARRRGDVVGARRRLDELLARFPFGALADSARREAAELPRARGAPRAP